MSEAGLYERLGEREGIREVVDDFYDRLLEDPSLGPFFADADLEKLRRTQTVFLCDAAGGPETYDDTPVREAHIDVPFMPAHIDRALRHLEDSLEEAGVEGGDADAVVEAVASYESDLLAGPADED